MARGFTWNDYGNSDEHFLGNKKIDLLKAKESMQLGRFFYDVEEMETKHESI